MTATVIKTWSKAHYRTWVNAEKVFIAPNKKLPFHRWNEFWQSVVTRGWRPGEFSAVEHRGVGLYPKYFWKWRAEFEGEPCQNRERPHFFGGAVEHRGERLRLRKEIFEMSK